jgi:DNA-directed RNA polymerase specialized sigma24 family protein
MLNDLCKHQKELLQMAKKFDCHNFDDLLQDTYIKLHESGKKFHEIDFGYIYLTMRSVFINKYRKKTEVLIDDFSTFEILEPEEQKPDVYVNLDLLKPLEKQLYYAYFGKKIINDKNEIIAEINPANLSRISRETGIPYVTIYKRFQRIKRKLCKDLETQLKQLQTY